MLASTSCYAIALPRPKNRVLEPASVRRVISHAGSWLPRAQAMCWPCAVDVRFACASSARRPPRPRGELRYPSSVRMPLGVRLLQRMCQVGSPSSGTCRSLAVRPCAARRNVPASPESCARVRPRDATHCPPRPRSRRIRSESCARPCAPTPCTAVLTARSMHARERNGHASDARSIFCAAPSTLRRVRWRPTLTVCARSLSASVFWTATG